eukprot:403367564
MEQSLIKQVFADFPIDILRQSIRGWETVESLEDLSITLPGGFSGTTYLAENKKLTLNEHNPVIFKLHNPDLRPGLDKELKVAQILSDQKWGPHIYYKCTNFRIEKYLDTRHMGIFEMRNPYYMQQIVEKMVQFHYNDELNTSMIEHHNGVKRTLIENFNDNLYPQFLRKFDEILLNLDEYEEYREIIQIIKQNYYDIDLIQFLDNLMKEDEILDEDVRVSHYDIQQGNILVFNKDQAKICIIDYEDPAFAPRSNDLGSFLGCFMKDNAHPEGSGIKQYFENAITEREVRFAANHYLTYYHQTFYKGQLSLRNYLDQHLEQFYEDVVVSMIFMNIYYGTWSVIRLRSELKGTFLNMGFARVFQNQHLFKLNYVQKILHKRRVLVNNF